mmetsp:Transcript_22869/g.47712  ORF Transcript_22869/g.47712 Transcript_22869/m.47712 type:complete len:85 (-) Transcript_22869:1107-1361(-)
MRVLELEPFIQVYIYICISKQNIIIKDQYPKSFLTPTANLIKYEISRCGKTNEQAKRNPQHRQLREQTHILMPVLFLLPLQTLR